MDSQVDFIVRYF